jgi:uncharacterized protein
MKNPIEEFLKCKKIAVLGMSSRQIKWGNRGAAAFKRHNYQIFAIHPQADFIDGEKCYPSLSALPQAVDGVWICIPPDRIEPVIREAAAQNIQNIWMQPGAATPELEILAVNLGMNVVAGPCILNYLV